MLRSRRAPLVTTREGCAAQFRTVFEGANSSEFSKQKAALTAFDSLCENQCVSALIYIMRDFSESDDPLKQHLAKKAKEYLKRTQQ
jgi:hypothetical protein